MNTFRSLLLATTLITVGACQSAPKQVGADTAATPAPPPIDSVAPPTASTATPAPTAPSAAATRITTKPQAQVKSQPPVKEPAIAKTATTPSAADLAARAAAAHADSLRQAQATADAMKAARADSVRQAEATRAAAAAKTAPTVTPPPPPSAPEGQAEAGKTPYEENCRKCHGVRGVPPKTMKEKFPKIATFDAAFFEKHSADSIVTVLTNGKNDDMKSFKDKLTHAEMVAVAAYIRSFVK